MFNNAHIKLRFLLLFFFWGGAFFFFFKSVCVLVFLFLVTICEMIPLKICLLLCISFGIEKRWNISLITSPPFLFSIYFQCVFAYIIQCFGNENDFISLPGIWQVYSKTDVLEQNFLAWYVPGIKAEHFHTMP